jgi:hypothetical protein
LIKPTRDCVTSFVLVPGILSSICFAVMPCRSAMLRGVSLISSGSATDRIFGILELEVNFLLQSRDLRCRPSTSSSRFRRPRGRIWAGRHVSRRSQQFLISPEICRTSKAQQKGKCAEDRRERWKGVDEEVKVELKYLMDLAWWR